VRAVWISAASGDWPRSTDPAEQQRSLIEILDILKNNNFNTVYFQVRPRGNVLYRSAIEPWATQLSGVLGKDPGYDPLEFAIEQAHARGLELHAWFNVAKVWGSEQLPQHPQHVTRTHRNWVKLVDGEWWIDLGIPQAREYTEHLVSELTDAYDVDGIHFDYIRYPSDTFDDWGSFTQWSDGAERAEWRRSNITTFVRNCYNNIQRRRPWIKVGSAPLGIYQSIAGAQSSFNGYSGVFQDSRRWLRERIHDYIVPQLYWSIGEQKNPNDPDFFVLSNDWVQENYERQVVIGIGAYRDNVQREVREQVITTRVEGAAGQAFFRYENLAAVLPRFSDLYRSPALIPAMIWKDSIAPNSPKNITVTQEVSGTVVRWALPDAASDKEEPVRYVVYRSTQRTVDTRRAENILAVLPSTERSYRDETASEKQFFYTVTAVDRAGNESGNVEKSSAESRSLFSRYASAERPAQLFRPLTGGRNGRVYLSFDLPKRMSITLSATAAVEGKDTVIIQQQKEGGRHIVSFDAKRFTAGRIDFRLTAGAVTLICSTEEP
jgi:uncharacterized lipoprotein YddW (UPF0748 family)